MTDDIIRRLHLGFAEVRLNRPAKKNALTAAMYDAMTDALCTAAADPDCACVLLTAEGGAFCAGNDIADFLIPGGAEAALRFIEAIAAFGKPIVAAVDGPAVGVGTTLLLHCSLIYASPAARFVVPFAKLGIVPEAGCSLLLPRIVGPAKASAMLLLGEPLGAAEAERAGLVTAIVAADALHGHALAKAEALAVMPPRALAATYGLMRGDRRELTERIAQEADALRVALDGAEAKEAFAAFLEKRAPDFVKLQG